MGIWGLYKDPKSVYSLDTFSLEELYALLTSSLLLIIFIYFTLTYTHGIRQGTSYEKALGLVKQT